MKIYIFLLFAILSLGQEQKLIFTFTLINQGTVTPTYPVPSMRWEDWEEGAPSELTAMGMREQYLLGYELRNRWVNDKFINDEYIWDQIYVRMIDHTYAIMSGQSFLRGFVGEKHEVLNPKQLELANPPIEVETYFKEKIGNLVLPTNISILPFHTYYPHPEDVLAPHYCRPAHAFNSKEMKKSEKVKDLRKNYEKDFMKIQLKYVTKPYDFPEYINLLESIASAIRQRKETRLSQKEVNLINSFNNEMYYYARSCSKDANQYLISGLLEHMRGLINDSVNILMNTTDPEKFNRIKRAVFYFTKDIMLMAFIKTFSKEPKFTLVPSSIISFQVKAPNKQQIGIDDLTVSIMKNDEPIDNIKFKEFLDKVSGLIKKDYKKVCGH